MEVTPTDVLELTGDTVTQETINLSLFVLGTELGFDLTDAELIAKLKTADVGLIRQAVIWQSVYLTKNPDLNRDRSIASVGVPGVSVSYRADQDFPISPLSIRALSWLSWRGGGAGIKTVGMRRADRDRCEQPDPWIRVR